MGHTTSRIRAFIHLVACAAIVVGAAAAGFWALRDMQIRTRGVTFGAAPEQSDAGSFFGVNAALDQYSPGDLARALSLIRSGGFYWVRQHFYWSEIEPRLGEYNWAAWDRIVDAADGHGLHLIAVLDTSPTWARSPGDRDLETAPPANNSDYARFVSAFVARYRGRVQDVQIWDNPNVQPFWGHRNADPLAYSALLKAAAIAARAANPDVRILSAGLAPSNEMIRGHPNYSDVLFLRGMYAAGARPYFDIVAAKPYGMWSGPEDRRVSPDVFNFSRVILLREEMIAQGDAAKPIWGVEFGWNALPSGWSGAPSPWGSDAEQVQADRLAGAVERARSEWPWMGALIAQTFQPGAPPEDPVWGFALFGRDWQPRPAYAALTRAMATPVQSPTFDFGRLYGALAALAVAAGVAAWRGAAAFDRLHWAEAWGAAHMRFAGLPEPVQWAILAAVAGAFYLVPNSFVSLALLAAEVLLFSFRLDIGLAIAVFTVPFYLLPKNLVGSMQFSMVELLTLASAAAWLISWVAQRAVARRTGERADLLSTIRRVRLQWLDWAVLLFLVAGLVGVKTAANFGVANREFRVIVFEPVLLYGLIRAARLSPLSLERIVDAFLASAVAVALIGLYQYMFTNYVIVGEGVRRVLAVYGSPNNLALYLDRALPLAIALALFAGTGARRATFAIAAFLVGVCLYFTYSRGSWLVGLPAGLITIGLLGGRRARFALAVLLVAAGIVLVPFAGTARFQSFFETGTGTGFFRVSVWQSALAMIRDHPVFGVGLDNFLYEYPKYMLPAAWREPNLSHPHNIVLDFWVRAGLLGLAGLAGMVIGFYREGLRAAPRGSANRGMAIGVVAAMTAALAHGMIDAAYFYVDLAFVLMLMLAVVVELREAR